jgi:hypothetical protein
MNHEKAWKYFEKKGITKTELARFLEHDYRTVQRWFSGEYPIPKLLAMAIEADIFESKEVLGVVSRRLVLKGKK